MLLGLHHLHTYNVLYLPLVIMNLEIKESTVVSLLSFSLHFPVPSSFFQVTPFPFA
uniref:Uncharacterized protein n=1 Tax=Rhizophora mucronata TaxID=61149 RepID=A0A2P2PYD9_RHIMU